MATIELRLSSKIQKETGYSEVLIRLFHGSKLNLRAKSEVYISSEHFEYFIDRKKTALIGTTVPDNAITATMKEAIEKGYVLFDRGEIFVRNRIISKDKVYHDNAKKKIDELKKLILESYNESDKESLSSEWIQTIVDKYHHPEKYIPKDEKPPFFDLMADFRDNSKKKVNGKREGNKSEVWKKNFNVLIRALQRYEMFIRLSDSNQKNFTLDVDTINNKTIEDIESFLRNEHGLIEDYPRVFAKFPISTDVRRKPQPRGNNTICALFTKFKAFFNWVIEKGITTNDPFVKYEGVKNEKYGTPYYITLEERNQIAEYDLSEHPHLAVQRDIFIFQCCIGCRISDLIKMTWNNVIDGAIEYIPHKTKGERLVVVRVPLINRACCLLNKYKGVDKKNRIFPFISTQKYNDSIKEIFRVCGITRMVTITDSLTGEEVQRPINEVASSHMARRTFVGNLYKKVQDPDIIASMSGHAEGSRAFARYRVIDEDVKKNAIKKME